MTRLNYLAHVAIHSKYKLLINLFILIIIYFMRYDNTVLLCMNDNPELTGPGSIAYLQEKIQRLEEQKTSLLRSRLEQNSKYEYLRSLSETKLNNANYEILALREKIDSLEYQIQDLKAQKNQLPIDKPIIADDPVEVNKNNGRSVIHPILRGSYCFLLGISLGLILLDSAPVIIESLSQVSMFW